MAVAEAWGYAPPELVFLPSQELFPDVPPHHIRKEQLSEELLNTSTHELNHSLVGMENLVVKELSTVPQDDVEGYTSYGAHGRAIDYQMAAAASMVPGPHGSPRGFGSDLFQIHRLSRFTKLSVQGAIDGAAAILSKYEFKVREYAAEIIACLKIVSGSDIKLVLEKARREIQEEEHREVFLPKVGILTEEMRYQEDVEPEIRIIRRRLPDGNVIEQMIEVHVCRVCGGQDGHMRGCEVAVQGEADGYYDSLEPAA